MLKLFSGTEYQNGRINGEHQHTTGDSNKLPSGSSGSKYIISAMKNLLDRL